MVIASKKRLVASAMDSKPGTGAWIALRDVPIFSDRTQRLGKHTDAAVRKYPIPSSGRCSIKHTSSPTSRPAWSIGCNDECSDVDCESSAMLWCRSSAFTKPRTSSAPTSEPAMVATTSAWWDCKSGRFCASNSARESRSSQCARSRRRTPIEIAYGLPSNGTGWSTSGSVTADRLRGQEQTGP